MELHTRFRIANLVSLILAIVVIITSGLLLKETYTTRNSEEFRLGRQFLNIMKNALDVHLKDTPSAFNPYLADPRLNLISKVDVDKILRIRLACSATILAASILQFLFGVVFLIYSPFKEENRTSGKIYLLVITLVWLAIGLAIACLLKTEVGKLNPLLPCIITSSLDFLALIGIIVVAYSVARS